MATSNFDLGDDAPMFDTPERVSILAVMGLVFSLICFVPGTGVIASILGVAALIAIGGSRGRLSGRGLAIAAIVLGLIFSMIWAGVGLGAMKVWTTMKTEMLQPVSGILTDIEAKNYAAARTKFDPKVGPTITDAQFETFRQAYQAEVGSFQNMPRSAMEVWTSYAAIGQVMQNAQANSPSGTFIPVPGSFSNGPALVLLHITPGKKPSNATAPWTDLSIVGTKGPEVFLIGPAVIPPPAASPAAPEAPATPAAETKPADAPPAETKPATPGN